jgi:hypothetical protein
MVHGGEVQAHGRTRHGTDRTKPSGRMVEAEDLNRATASGRMEEFGTGADRQAEVPEPLQVPLLLLGPWQTTGGVLVPQQTRARDSATRRQLCGSSKQMGRHEVL